MDPLPIVLPVSFSGGGLSMQTTSSKLSDEKAFVRGPVQPRDGARVNLSISLPAGFALVLDGTVGERVPPGDKGREVGFWVQFQNVKAETRDRLLGFLSSKGAAVAVVKPPEPPMDLGRRSFPRLASRFKVSWASPREFLEVYSDNISRGGIFVATDNPPPLREMVELSLELPDGKGPAKTHAEVVQRVTPDEARVQNRSAGAGLQFIGSDDDFRARLDACIENLLTA